jgi:oligosaccharide repeat unit polymerase
LSLVLPVVLIALATAPVLDALRRRGALARPEFYLLVTLYLYGTGGYLTYLVLPPGVRFFLLPVSGLSVHTSYLYAVAAVLAVYVGGRLYDPKVPELRYDRGRERIFAAFAFAACVLALALNLYYFSKFGFLSGNFDRVVFIDEFKAGGGFSLPYISILLAALPILALNERWPLSWLVVAAYALLHVPVGDRRDVLAALIVVFVAKLLRGTRLRRGTMLVSLAVILVAGVVVGATRGGAGFSGLDFGSLFIGLSEFSRPFVALAYHVDAGYEPTYGWNLIQAIISVVPGSVLPFDKFPSPGQQFRDLVGGLGVFPGRVSGYGFYPVAEVLFDFGPVGIPVFYLLFAALVRRLSRLALATGYAFVVPVLCTAMFSYGRSSLSNVLATHFWVVVIGVALLFAARLTSEVVERQQASRGTIETQPEG